MILSGRKPRVIPGKDRSRGDVKTEELRERAGRLLANTEAFQKLGLGEMSADARMLARLCLELCDELEVERSVRVAIQKREETLLSIVGAATYNAMLEDPE